MAWLSRALSLRLWVLRVSVAAYVVYLTLYPGTPRSIAGAVIAVLALLLRPKYAAALGTAAAVAYLVRGWDLLTLALATSLIAMSRGLKPKLVPYAYVALSTALLLYTYLNTPSLMRYTVLAVGTSFLYTVIASSPTRPLPSTLPLALKALVITVAATLASWVSPLAGDVAVLGTTAIVAELAMDLAVRRGRG